MDKNDSMEFYITMAEYSIEISSTITEYLFNEILLNYYKMFLLLRRMEFMKQNKSTKTI